MNLNEIIANLISSKREGDYWDFKEEPHDNNGSLLHDIYLQRIKIVLFKEKACRNLFQHA